MDRRRRGRGAGEPRHGCQRLRRRQPRALGQRGRRTARSRLDGLRLLGRRERALHRVGSGRPALGLRSLEARGRARRSPLAGPDHAIVRTAWLFGAGGRNFVDTMLTLGAERDELRVVDDQVGCPTWTGHLAPALVELAEASSTDVFHVAAAGRCSWFELARTAIERAGIECAVRAGHDRGVPAAGAAAGLQRARQRARRPGAGAALLAGGARCVPRRARGDTEART